jgi:crotonobetainyl-CoA:carnitine CoA-transferase CaiB-like acyl-CoA transferase
MRRGGRELGSGTALRADYAALAKDNPRLIYCSITARRGGPYRDRPGYDFMVQGLGGL